MNKLLRSITLGFCGFFVIGLTACKQGGDGAYSRIKTLDSIANGTLNLNAYQCKGSGHSDISDQKIIFDVSDTTTVSENQKSEIRRAVKDYMSALPNSAESLFLSMGGQVLITQKVNQICANSHYGRNLDETKGEKTDGCFHFVSDPSGKESPIFTIVHSPDAKKIRYYGPQIFGYLYAQFYSRLTIRSDGRGLTISEQEPLRLIALKERVANAFLNDILATRDYKIDVIENLLGQSSDQELKNTSIEKPLERLSSLRDQKRRSQFLDYVFANSFQSAHCNNTSLEVAKTKFKRSSALFAEIDAAVLQASNILSATSGSAAQSTSGSSSAAFSLTDESLSLAEGGILSSIMPMFSSLLGMSGGGGSGGIAGIFMKLLGGSAAGGSIMPSGASDGLKIASSLFSQLSASGCSGGSCSGCSGSCSGGACSSCSNGGCGGCSGGCSCASF